MYLGVGKSCALHQFISKQKITPPYVSTTEVKESSKHITINGNNVLLRIFDSSGNPIFTNPMKVYLRCSDGILLFYDVTNKLNFLALKKWVKIIK